MITESSLPLSTALRSILWKHLMVPYLIAMLLTVGLAAFFGGQWVELQQLRYSRSIGYIATRFLFHATQELDALTVVVSTKDMELINISIDANRSSHDLFDTMYVLDHDKRIITLAPYDPRYIGMDMSRRSYFDNLDCDAGVNFSIPFTSLRTGEPTAYLLRCTDSGEYIIGELNLGALQDAITEAAIPSNETIFIVDQTGTLLAHPDHELVAQHVNVGDWQIVKEGLKQNSSVNYWHDGSFWLGSTSQIPLTGWIVVSEVRILKVYAPYLGILIALALALMLIFSISARIFLNQVQQKLVAPLIQLSGNADALADGNYRLSESGMNGESSYAEINRLLSNFQKMGHAIVARESLLKESEEQYRRLLEYSPNAILLHRNSVILYANAAAVALYDAKDASELINRSVLDVIHPESQPLAQSRLQKLEEREQVLPLVEQRHVKFDRQVFQAEVVTSSVFFAGAYVAQTIVRDITRQKNEEKALRHRATHDPLTNLPNRFLFQDRLEQAMAKSRRNNILGAVLYLDLDDFKSINDAFGHSIGDQVLQYVASSLRRTLREVDTIARMSGDEFVVLLDVIKDPFEAEFVADNILRTFSVPYPILDKEIMISFSVGISIFPTDGMDTHLLLQSADAAMYRAKDEGKRRVKYFAPYMREQSLERVYIQTQLSHALEQNQFFLQYQPQVQVGSGEIIGVEALLRWRHPELGLVSPAKFIPIAEETGLILPIGEWILRTACEQAQAWKPHNIRLAINLSQLQLKQPHIVKTIRDAINDFDQQPELLEIELTENIVFHTTGTSFDDLYKLKSLGVSLAMDDFGSGFSTLGYLAHIPFDRIKVDQRLVSNVHNPKDAAVVSGIFDICRNLGLDVIAEGVETREQLDFCISRGCKYVQGWYYSHAVEPSVITDYLLHGYPWKSELA